MRHLTEEELVLFFYRELESRPADAEHLERCPGCRQRYEHLEAVLLDIQELSVPEPPADYEDQTWNRIKPALEKRESVFKSLREAFKESVQRWLHSCEAGGPRWATALIALALLAAVFLAGRASSAGGKIDAPALQAAIEKNVRAELARELDVRFKQQDLSLLRNEWAQFAGVYSKNLAEDRREVLLLRRDLETLVVEAGSRLELADHQIGRLALFAQQHRPGSASGMQ